MKRRDVLKASAAVAAFCATAPISSFVHAEPSPLPATGKDYTLPPLPYALDALEPHIDAKTMEIHYSKHHQAYVNKLNEALSSASLAHQTKVEDLLQNLSALPESVRTAVKNNAGGHYNHSLFWQMMRKQGGGAPKGELAKAIERSFGSFTSFQDQFTKAGTTLFGSGWIWLTVDGDALKIIGLPNQDSPISQGQPPLLGVDVWEHAYYLKYQNRRSDYLAAWWNVINWDFIADRFSILQKSSSLGR